MCRKCLEKMQDPKFVVNPDNMDVVKTMVKIMQEDCLKILHTILRFTEEQTGKPINPAAIALAWGWFYHASTQNHILKGDFTQADLDRFDTALKSEVTEGVKQAWSETGEGDAIYLVDETDLPDAINRILADLGLEPLPKPPEGGNLH